MQNLQLEIVGPFRICNQPRGNAVWLTIRSGGPRDIPPSLIVSVIPPQIDRSRERQEEDSRDECDRHSNQSRRDLPQVRQVRHRKAERSQQRLRRRRLRSPLRLRRVRHRRRPPGQYLLLLHNSAIGFSFDEVLKRLLLYRKRKPRRRRKAGRPWLLSMPRFGAPKLDCLRRSLSCRGWPWRRCDLFEIFFDLIMEMSTLLI